MKKASSKTHSKTRRKSEENDLLPEYDFSGGVRGKYYRAYHQGYEVKIHKADGTVEEHIYKPEEGVVLLDKDVRNFFSDAESVNNALRGLIALIPQKEKESEHKAKSA